MSTATTVRYFRYLAGSGYWTDPAKWTGAPAGSLPGSGDVVVMPSAAGQYYTVTGNAQVGTIVVSGSSPGGVVTFNGAIGVSGNMLTANATADIVGSLTVGGQMVGDYIVDGSLTLTSKTACSALNSLRLNAGSTYTAGVLQAGSLTVAKGSVITLAGIGNSWTGASALVFGGPTTIIGATLTANGSTVFNFTFTNPIMVTVGGGSTVVDQNLTIGQPGVLTVTGVGTSWRDVGNGGPINAGDLSLSGGSLGGVAGSIVLSDHATMSQAGSATMGYQAGVTNQVTVDTGAGWSVGRYMEIGVLGGGAVRLQGGGTLTEGNALAAGGTGLYLGMNAGSTGALTADGAGTSLVVRHGAQIGFSGNGTLALSNGATAQLGDGTAGVWVGAGAGTGRLSAAGAATVAITGALAVGAKGTLAATTGGTVAASGAAALSGGSIAVDATGGVVIGATRGAVGGAVEVAAGGTLSGFGTVAAGVVDNGLITACGGTLSLVAGPGQSIGGGNFAVINGATLALDGTAAGTQSVRFASGTGQSSALSLAHGRAWSIDATGFGAGATIRLCGEAGAASVTAQTVGGATRFLLGYADGTSLGLTVEGVSGAGLAVASSGGASVISLSAAMGSVATSLARDMVGTAGARPAAATSAPPPAHGMTAMLAAPDPHASGVLPQHH